MFLFPPLASLPRLGCIPAAPAFGKIVPCLEDSREAGPSVTDFAISKLRSRFLRRLAFDSICVGHPSAAAASLPEATLFASGADLTVPSSSPD